MIHKKHKPKNFWNNIDNCKNAALECKTRNEFKKKYDAAYDKSCKNKWLDEICIHMIEIKKPDKYWDDKNKCRNAAFECKTRKEFSVKYSDAYMKSRKNKWLDEICSHMIEVQQPDHYWTKEKCRSLSLLCSTKKEFRSQYYAAYRAAALKKYWIDEICSHMVELKKPAGYWTKERCKEEALIYKTKSDFLRNSSVAYMVSNKNCWSNEICSHMIPLTNTSNRLIYLFEFEDNFVYIGLTWNSKQRFNDHMREKDSSVFKHMKKTNSIPKYSELTDYIEMNEASEKEIYYIELYRSKGYNILNKIKGGGVGGSNKKDWSYGKCKNIANMYYSRTEFSKKNRYVFEKCKKNNWLDDFFTKRIEWNYENCKIESEKYSNRNEFHDKKRTVYDRCKKNNWLNDFF